MRKAILFFFLLFAIHSQAQTAAEVDSIVRLYPKTASSVVRLADRINKDFTTEFGKARAIYTWIALNISYDYDFFYKMMADPKLAYTSGEKQNENILMNQILMKRKGICDDYSRLFQRLAELCNLESEIIVGIARQSVNEIGDTKLESNHAWNSVKIDDKWRLIDVTWGSGGIIESGKYKKGFTTFYFDTEPKLFFLNHYPESGKWLDSNIDKETFISLPNYYLSNETAAYQMKEPLNGIIHIDPNNKQRFLIANLSAEHHIDYIINEETFSIENQKEIGSNLEFEIDLSEKPIGTLTICIDGNCWVEYKLIKGQ